MGMHFKRIYTHLATGLIYVQLHDCPMKGLTGIIINSCLAIYYPLPHQSPLPIHVYAVVMYNPPYPYMCMLW